MSLDMPQSPREAHVSVATLCRACHGPIPEGRRRGSERVHCSPACRRKAWDDANRPRVQASLAFEPAPIRVAQPPHNPKLVSKLKPAALNVLGLLGDFEPHSRHELARVGGARYSARVGELRDAGQRILGPSKSARHAIFETEPAGPGGLEMYRLVR